MQEATTTLRERLRHRIDVMKTSQAELADDLGLEYSQNITGWINRDTIPTKHLFKAASILGCNAEWLTQGTGPEIKTGGAVDATVLAEILSGVQLAVEHVGLDWTVTQVTQLVAELYSLYDQTGDFPDPALLARLEALRQK